MTEPLLTEVDRATVSAGLDFRPLPIDVGDGKRWLFQADPSPAKYDALVKGLAGFAVMAGAGESTEKALEAAEQVLPLLQTLEAAITDLLTTDAQKKKFIGTYGPSALQTFAAVLMEPTGFPTEQP